MLSLIDVQCPHCGARGQIMVPPVGAMIIGPCPQCSELVTVFCGQVLPLEKEIMETGSVEERREHLLDTLMEFLRDRIERLIGTDEEQGLLEGIEAGELPTPNEEPLDHLEDMSVPTLNTSAPISQTEIDQFSEVDLKLLDSKSYFNSIFGDQ